MKFETSKVIYDNKQDDITQLLGKPFYFHDNLLDLQKVVESENRERVGILLDVKDATFPFMIEEENGNRIWASLIYQAEGVNMVRKEYRAYEYRQELYNKAYDLNEGVPEFARPLVWIRHKESGNVLLITGYLNNGVFADTFYSFAELFEKFEYLDGTPCGVRVI